jgi:hypothetical protein
MITLFPLSTAISTRQYYLEEMLVFFRICGKSRCTTPSIRIMASCTSVLLANCIALCFRPYAGNDHDAKTVVWAGLITVMHSIASEVMRVFSQIPDSAHPQGRYMQVIQKCPLGGQLSQSSLCLCTFALTLKTSLQRNCFSNPATQAEQGRM